MWGEIQGYRRTVKMDRDGDVFIQSQEYLQYILRVQRQMVLTECQILEAQTSEQIGEQDTAGIKLDN